MTDNELLLATTKLLLCAAIEQEGRWLAANPDPNSITRKYNKILYGNDHQALALNVAGSKEIPKELLEIFNDRPYRDAPPLDPTDAESVIATLDEASTTISNEVAGILGHKLISIYEEGGNEGGGEKCVRVYAFIEPELANELAQLRTTDSDVHRQAEIINNSICTFKLTGIYASYNGIEWNDRIDDAKCKVKEVLLWD